MYNRINLEAEYQDVVQGRTNPW